MQVRRAFSRLRALLFKKTSLHLAGSLIVNGLRIVSTVILTRLLSADDFGAVGITTSIMIVFVLLSDVGFFAFVVRSSRAAEPRFLDEVWTLRLVRGIAIAATIAALAVPLAHLFAKPMLAPLIAVMGLSLLFEGLTSMSFATAAREGRIGRLVLLDVLPAAAQLLVAIPFAIWLRSYWAIAIGMVASGLLKIALSYLLFPGSARRLRFSAARSRELWRFGWRIATSSIAQIIISQTDKIVFARLFSLGQFGLYTLATNLSQVPTAATANYSPRILYPVYASTWAEAPTRLSDAYYRAGRPLQLLYLAGVAGLIGVAPLLIEILYDDRYRGAALYLEILAVGALFRFRVMTVNDMMLARGDTAHGLKVSALRVATLAGAGTLLFIAFGAIGLVWAVAIVEIVSQLYSWWVLHRIGVLRILKEAAIFLAVPVGLGIGWLVNTGGLAILR